MNKQNPQMFSSLKNLFEIISFRHRLQMIWLLPLMIVVGFAEVLNIGIVIPFIGVLISPDFLVGNEIYDKYFSKSELFKPDNIRFTLTLALITATILATLFKVVLIWLRTRLSFFIGGHISRKVFRNSLDQTFETFMYSKSSDLIAAMTVKADTIAQKVILPILTLLSGSVILIIFVIGLIYTMPSNLLIGGFTIILGYILVTLAVRRILMREGQAIANHISSLFHLAKESLDGFSEIKIYSLGKRQFRKFSFIDSTYRQSLTKNSFLSEFPKSIFESLIILGFAFYCYSLIGDGEDTTLVGYIPILGGLAYVAQKMIPVLQQVYNSWSTILASIPIVDDVVSIAKEKYPDIDLRDTFLDIEKDIDLEFKNVSYKTPQGMEILNNISLIVGKGEKIALVGESGSGKTTFLNLASLMLQPSEGEIYLNGNKINEKTRISSGTIGYAGQSAYVFNATVGENITLKEASDITKEDHKKVNNLLNRMSLLSDNKSTGIHSKTVLGPGGAQISGGEKQRISIARMMFCKSKINLFDESTSALDLESEDKILNELFSELSEATIIFVTHRDAPVNFCDRVITFDQGRIVKTEEF